MSNLSDFTDEKGFIGHKGPEGLTDFGDSAQRTFTKALYDWDVRYGKDPSTGQTYLGSEVAGEVLRKLELIKWKQTDFEPTKKDGWVQYSRHWNKLSWPGQLWIMSRDNFKSILWILAILANCGVIIASEELRMIIGQVKARKYLAWNYKKIWPLPHSEPKLPDWILPTIIWGAEIRGKARITLLDRVKLWLYDSIDFAGTVVLVTGSWRKPNETSSDLNQINEHVYKKMTRSTWISWLCCWFYGRFRRAPKYDGQMAQTKFYALNNIQKVIRTYYWHTDHPPMWEALDPLIAKYVRK